MGRSGESGTQMTPSFFITEGVVGPIPVKRNVRKITGLILNLSSFQKISEYHSLMFDQEP